MNKYRYKNILRNGIEAITKIKNKRKKEIRLSNVNTRKYGYI